MAYKRKIKHVVKIKLLYPPITSKGVYEPFQRPGWSQAILTSGFQSHSDVKGPMFYHVDSTIGLRRLSKTMDQSRTCSLAVNSVAMQSTQYLDLRVEICLIGKFKILRTVRIPLYRGKKLLILVGVLCKALKALCAN